MFVERKMSLQGRKTLGGLRASAAAVVLSLPLLAVPNGARADTSPTSAATSAATAAPRSTTFITPAPKPARHAGFLVVAITGATDAVWPLATAIYRAPELGAASIDDAHARALAGEPVARDAPRELRDLSETVAAIRGDDAPSRKLLKSIAEEFGAVDIVVVFPATPVTRAIARVFVAATESFDSAQYLADDAASAPTQTPTWNGAVASIVRAFGEKASDRGRIAVAMTSPAALPGTATANEVAPPPPPPPPPSGASEPTGTTAVALDATPPPPAPSHPKMFYESGWFWGALGAAALAGTGVYFLTRDSGPSSIHLQMQVP